MDAARNARAYSQTVFELSGQPYDPDDPRLHTACSQTCRNHLAGVETAALEGVLVQLVRYLIRSKWFRDAMLLGCICVAVDAPTDVINAMTGKIGRLPGVSAKAIYSRGSNGKAAAENQ